MEKILVEVCCAAAQDVVEAERAGADRVELNAALFLGGLTPSVGELAVAKARAAIPVMAMVRPREGGFCYTELEFETALADARALLAAGADGIVFGFLHEDGAVDVERCRAMMEVVGGKQSVFHRAIDVVPDWRAALDALCGLGVTRVLTSGQQPSVPLGAATIRAMREYAAGRIEILPGGGVRLGNARQVVAETGCGQIHVSMRKSCSDPSALGNPDIHFGGALYPPEDRYQTTDGDKVRQLCDLVK